MRKNILYIVLFLIGLPLFSQLQNRVYQNSECGLNIIHKSVYVTKRYEDFPGKGYPGLIQLNELPPKCYEIVKAYIWTTVSYLNNEPDPIIININNPENKIFNFNSVKTGESIDKCWGEKGTRGYRADVTSAISGNGDYLIRSNLSEWETDGFTLIVVYKDLTAEYEGHITINDGLITEQGGRTSIDSLKNFLVCDNSNNAKFFTIVSDFQKSASSDFRLIINGKEYFIPSAFWNSEIMKDTVKKNQNQAGFAIIPRSSDCYSWLMMGLYYQTTTCRNCYFPTIKINAFGKDICPGDSLTLSANGADIYEWSSIPAGFTSKLKNPVVKPNASTKYVLKGMTLDSCHIGFDTIIVNVNPKPDASISPSDTVRLCNGDSVRLAVTLAGNGLEYLWSTGEKSRSINVKKSGTYTVIVTNSYGCTDTNSVEVIVNPPVSVNITPSKGIRLCKGESVKLGTSGKYYSYKWSTGEITDSIVINKPGTYSIDVTDDFGCHAYDTIYVEGIEITLSRLSSINMDVACVGDTVEKVFVMKNEGKDEFTVRTVYLQNGKKYFSALTNPGYPVILKSGEEFTCRVRYVPLDFEKNEDSLVIEITNEPCSERYVFFIQGRGAPKYIIWTPDTTGYIGKEMCLPVYIKLNYQTNKPVDINYSADISFSKDVIYPSQYLSKIENGRRIVHLSGLKRQVLNQPTELDRICGLVLLGDTLTKVQIDNFTDLKNVTCIDTIQSNFKLTGVCAITLSKVKTIESVDFNIFPNPASDYVNVKISGLKTGYYDLTISNITGEIIGELEGSLDDKSKETVLNIDINNFQTGTYFLKFKNNEDIINRIFQIIR